MKSNIYLHHIAYSPETLVNAEPGYIVLNNLENKRPDWFEYWPIRNFLLNTEMDENSFYGFFSPKFSTKTGLNYTDVFNCIEDNIKQADVFLFSPQPDMGAFFLNVFEQGETFDPGLIAAYEEFLLHVGQAIPLRNLVMDSRTIVFSNYFVARPKFWREWLHWNELLFSICEGPPTDLQNKLRYCTTYPGAVERKVFLVERTASLLLTLQPEWRTYAVNPFSMAWSMTRLRDFPIECYIHDALKIAFNEQKYPQYIEAFSEIRNKFILGKG